MNKIYFVLITVLLLNFNLNAQTPFASEIIIVNGESFGTNKSNIASYNILTKEYEVFDSLKTNSVQDILIEDDIAYISAQTKIFSYDLSTKTKIAESPYLGVSPNRGSLFTDDNNLYVGNWYGQSDSNIYAYDKNTLALQYSIAGATLECAGGLSLNDTLYVSQRIKGTIDGCAPYGCFTDTMGSIILTSALNGSYLRTINLGTSGSGVEQIYSNENYLFAVCPSANKIIKIEIGTDAIVEEVSLAPFTQSLLVNGTKIYLDFNDKAGYYDMSDGTFALSALELLGAAKAYDPNSETVFNTYTDYFSYGSFSVTNSTSNDTISVGISPEAIGIYYIPNQAPITENDSFEYVYEETVSDYLLDVLANDNDPNGTSLTISNLSSTNVSGALVSIVGSKIKYERSAGIATTDYFTYDACNAYGTCTSAIVEIKLKSVTSISTLKSHSIKAYPNPTSGVLNIDTDSKIELIQVFDITGIKVKISKESKINLSDLNKGTYFVVIRTTSDVLNTQITVK